MARPKTPTNILNLRGADKHDPARFKNREHEPKPAKGIAKPPAWLSRRGRKIFRELAEITTAMGVLTVADHPALAMLSDAYDGYFVASEAITEHGMTYTITNRDGDELVKANPAVAMKSDAWRRIQSGLSKFGLDPSSRAGLVVNHPESDNPFDVDPPTPRSQMRKIPGLNIIVPI